MSTTIRTASTLVLLAAVTGGVSSQSVTWSQISTKTAPPARAFHAMAYDAARDRVVVFGGRTGSTYMDDTWEFDGTNWSEMKPTKSPAKRFDARMVYDPIRKRIILFGGQDKDAYGDTWEWDGSNWTLRTSATSPSRRRASSMFFDPKLGKIVLFGGRSAIGGFNYNDTWTWDGSKWAELSPKSPPAARMGAPVDYDVKRGRAVMFGGWSGSERGDTWEWDGSKWTEFTTTVGPDDRNDASIVGLSGAAVLFGGFGSNRKPRGDTWTFDGKGWMQIKLPKSPAARYSHRAVYDSKRERILLFAGSNNFPSGLFNDTWSLPVRLATFKTFGKGCASSTALPTISSTTVPRLGQSLELHIKGFLPKAQIGQLILGASDKTWGTIPLPLPLSVINMGNCVLFVSIDIVHPIATDPQGNAQTIFKVPSDTSFLGAVLFGQAVVPDAKANTLGLATTNAFKAVVGL